MGPGRAGPFYAFLTPARPLELLCQPPSQSGPPPEPDPTPNLSRLRPGLTLPGPNSPDPDLASDPAPVGRVGRGRVGPGSGRLGSTGVGRSRTGRGRSGGVGIGAGLESGGGSVILHSLGVLRHRQNANKLPLCLKVSTEDLSSGVGHRWQRSEIIYECVKAGIVELSDFERRGRSSAVKYFLLCRKVFLFMARI
ncbi:unnamed protein product [Calypogeia fissa]